MASKRVLTSGLLVGHVEGLRAALSGRGYAPSTQVTQERLLRRLSGWLDVQGIEPAGLTVPVVDRFAADCPGCRVALVPGLSTVLGYLRAVGAVPSPPGPGAAGVVLGEYRQYLLVNRRLAVTTAETRADVVRRFLAWLGTRDELDLSGLTAGLVHGFVLAEARRLRGGSISPVLDSTRSFLRFLFATGVLGADLSGVLPAVTPARHMRLPEPVSTATLRALLASCDRSKPVGLRDFAILTVLSRLGLRAGEIAAMTLDDLDWRAGELTVHSKGGRRDRLPLPTDVGRALAAYLRAGRPATTSRAVFMSAHAPMGPLSPNGVVFVPRTASRRARLPVIGAHLLRHTTASGLLAAGGSLREVGEVLRHERAETTAIYTSVAPRVLQHLVRPWPGTAR